MGGGKEFSADEWDEQERGDENRQGRDEGDRGMVEAPVEGSRVLIANPVVDGILLFLYATLEPVGSEHGNDREGQNKSADEREAHGVRHRVKEFSGGPGERVNRQIARDDDGDGIKDGAIDVARGGKDDVG